MSKLTREIWIDAPKNEVWAALADFGNIYRFNPSVPSSHSTNELSSGEGATRHCDFLVEGSSVEERIVEWHEGDRMVVEIYEGVKTPPWENVFADIAVEEVDGGTLVRGTMSYDMRYGPVGSLMDRFMIQPQFGKAWGGIFAGLKQYIETGEEVSGSDGLPFDKLVLVPA